MIIMHRRPFSMARIEKKSVNFSTKIDFLSYVKYNLEKLNFGGNM